MPFVFPLQQSSNLNWIWNKVVNISGSDTVSIQVLLQNIWKMPLFMEVFSLSSPSKKSVWVAEINISMKIMALSYAV